jgi:hypothetical protein
MFGIFKRVAVLEERIEELEGFCAAHIGELFDRVDALSPAPKKKRGRPRKEK